MKLVIAIVRPASKDVQSLVATDPIKGRWEPEPAPAEILKAAREEGGVAHAFKVMERAFALLDPDGPLERREITVATAFGGPGARDGFEMVARAVTGDRYVLDADLARPERGTTLERFVFRVGYRKRSVTLLLRRGIRLR